MLDLDIAVLGPAERLETLAKCNDPSPHFGIILGVWMQECDGRMRSPCCARPASGHAAVAPPSRMTKSRRRIPDTRASPLAVGPPHAQLTTDPVAGP